MKWHQWICGGTAMVFIITAGIASNGYGQDHQTFTKGAVAGPFSLKSLSPQPEPPDRKWKLNREKKVPLRPHKIKSLGPQPEPPDKTSK